ncbi:helix-turn-helix domain-containing protein [Vibrio sp. HN007]|uniref:AraC family transcriptional regulator n=1 Tax=Vibrio iocasae TaxID=3098914 RepID=UPI0035D4A6F5
MTDKVEYFRLSDSHDLMLSQGAYSEYTFKPHYHIDFHIGLVVSGVQEQKFNRNKVLLAPGRISVMPPGEVHDGITYRDSPYQLNTFRISPELVQACFSDMFSVNNLPQFGGAMVENHQISQQLVYLFNYLKHQKEITSLPFEEQWLKTLLPLLENLTKRKSTVVKGALSDKHLNWVVEYCHENISDKISLDQLSSLSDLNRYQFLRRFEKSVGITPHKWLTQLRLERACQLMRKSDKSIAEISAEVGFFDQSHFNRAFKSLYGVAPSMY